MAGVDLFDLSFVIFVFAWGVYTSRKLPFPMRLIYIALASGFGILGSGVGRIHTGPIALLTWLGAMVCISLMALILWKNGLVGK